MKRLAISAALFVLTFPAEASATIVVNRGIYGVRLGETMKQVRRYLGTPADIRRVSGRTWWFYFQLDLALDFRGRNRLLHSLFIQSTGERTASGVGVGSSEQDVKRLVRGVQCGTIPLLQGKDCFVSSHSGGTRYETHFDIDADGHVDSVLIEWGSA